jgi:plasmid maintenance system antidote protein VapI
LIKFSNIIEHNVLDMNIYSIYFRVMIKNILDKVDISSRHFSYLLNGDRNATPTTAIQIERATGIPKELWVFGSALERKTAWENFLKQQEDS